MNLLPRYFMLGLFLMAVTTLAIFWLHGGVGAAVLLISYSLLSFFLYRIFKNLKHQQQKLEDDRQMTESELRQTQLEQKAMLAAMPDLMFVLDQQGTFLEVKLDEAHPLMEEMLGRRLHEISFIPEGVADLILRCIQTTLQSKQMQTAEYRLPSLDRMSDYETRFVALDDQRVLYISRDISESKQQELALRESEQKYREVARAAQRHTRELELLDQIRNTIAKQGELKLLLQAVVESVAQVLDYPYVTIGLIKGQHLEIQHHIGYDDIAQSVNPLLDIGKGVIGRVALSGESALIPDVKLDPDYYLGPNNKIISEICVPLKQDHKVVGILNVETTREVLSENHLETLEKVADYVGIALQRMRLFEELKSNEQNYRNLYERSQMQAEELSRQTNELLMLDQVRSLVSNKIELNAVYDAVIQAVHEVLGYEKVSILLIKGNMAEVQQQRGYPGLIDKISVEQGILGRVIRNKAAEFIADVKQDPDYFAVDEAVVSDIIIPFMVQQQVAGVLIVESQQPLHEMDFELLSKVGAYISMAMEQAQLYSDLQSSEARYKGIIENANDMIYRTDRKGNFIFMNAMVTKLLGYDEKIILDFNYLDLIHPDYRQATAQFYYSQLQEQHVNSYYEFPALHKEGHIVWIGQNVQLILNQGKFEGFQAVARDITERKHMQDMLLQQTEALGRANAELEQFAFIAAHDLQEPLRKIQAFGDRLSSKYKQSLDEQGQDYLSRMQASAGRMRDLISDLLTFAKVSKEESREKVDLNLIVKDVIGDLQARLEDTQGHIQLEVLPTLEANPTQMRQLFQNLLGNAIKFRRPEVAPVVQVHSQQRIDGGYTIQVSDNGIGFDESYKDRIFKVFQRLHGRDRYEGTGMGLAIVRKIIDTHKASIDVSSQVGQGTTFTLHFPPVLHTIEASLSLEEARG
jgi:PAS domain S-box-containing protein